MAFKPNETVTTDVVGWLLENGEPESQVLDYKRELPVRDDNVRHDFLEDVAAFANTAGGVILYGISERQDKDGQPTGVPHAVVGLEGNLDKHVQRLEAKLGQLVKPKIPGVVFDRITGVEGGPVLAVRVPRSWAAPHLIHKPGDSKWVCFYTRKSSGNQHLDWHEIKSAYVANEGQRERIERFRNDRVGKIASNSVGWPLSDDSKLIVHVVPLGAVGGEAKVDVHRALNPPQGELGWIKPMGAAGWDSRATLEGALTFRSRSADGAYLTYVLLSREGIIEAVKYGFVRRDDKWPQPKIASQAYEETVLRALPGYLSELQRVGATPPLLVLLSATGVKGQRWRLTSLGFTPETDT